MTAHFERRFALQDELREAYARMLGTPAAEVALTTSTSDGLGRVLAGLHLGSGDEIVTSDQEHPGLVGPLLTARRRGVTVRAVPLAHVAEAVGPETTLVAVSHVSWIGGEVAPAALSELDVPVILDGAQGAGAVHVDPHALGCAAYAASGQKWLCGADGTGLLWIHPRFAERVDAGDPELRQLRRCGGGPRRRLQGDRRPLRHAVAVARGGRARRSPRSACSKRPAGRRCTSAPPRRRAGSRTCCARAGGR